MENITEETAYAQRIIITEEHCQQALDEYPEVHPGWKFAFTRSREVMAELRHKRKNAMNVEGKTPYLDRAA